jgi:hypothetical protein
MSVAFHPSTTVFASAGTDKSIKLYDIRMHALIQHYENAHVPSNPSVPMAGVNSISFGGLAGEYLISAGCDAQVKIWDVKEGHLYYTLHGHKSASTDAVFSPDSQFFATAGADNLVMLWRSHFGSQQKAEKTKHVEAVEKKFAAPKHVIPPETKSLDISPAAVPEPVKAVSSDQDSTVAKPEQPIISDKAETAEQPVPVPAADKTLSKQQMELIITESVQKQVSGMFSTFHGEYSNALKSIAQQVDMLTQTVGVLEVPSLPVL